MTAEHTSVVRRTSLFVRDMERAVAFYTEAFGFRAYHDRELHLDVVPAFPLRLEPRQGSLRLVILRGGEPLVGMIGLMAVSGLAEPADDPRRLGYGNAALVLSTTDAARAAARVEELGGQLVMPVTTARNIGDEAGNMIPARLFMAFDPDGHFLEVFEPL
jgi:predicted enzyme related to lactoylglutathione lyase